MGQRRKFGRIRCQIVKFRRKFVDKQTYVELDAALELLGEILEYFEEFQWTFRRKIGIFRSQKLDAELEYIEEISLINFYERGVGPG